MPRNSLYKANRLKLDYDVKRQAYVLIRDERDVGSVYRTDKQARSLVMTLRANIESDERFRGISLVVTQLAQERLNFGVVVDISE